MTFGEELVVLHTRPSMLGKFLGGAWRQCGGLDEEHPIFVRLGSNSFWHAKNFQNEFGPLNTDIGCSSFKFKKTKITSKHTPKVEGNH
jgi:hypothetical protein